MCGRSQPPRLVRAGASGSREDEFAGGLLTYKTVSCKGHAPPPSTRTPPQIHNEYGEPHDIVHDETDEDADDAIGPQGSAAAKAQAMDQKAFERMLLNAETSGVDQLSVRLIPPEQPKPQPPPAGWCAGCLRPQH